MYNLFMKKNVQDEPQKCNLIATYFLTLSKDYGWKSCFP